MSFLVQVFLVRLRLRLKKAPALTLPQARKLLVWNFPHLRSDLDDTLELVRYHQLRNDCAYRCHRQRRLEELATWATLAPQPPG